MSRRVSGNSRAASWKARSKSGKSGHSTSVPTKPTTIFPPRAEATHDRPAVDERRVKHGGVDTIGQRQYLRVGRYTVDDAVAKE